MKTRLALLSSLAAFTPSVLGSSVFAVAVPGSELRAAPTLGRQLGDLKQAHDFGAITEEEYQGARSG